MYGEHFDIPAPDELVLVSWFEGGEVFRSGCDLAARSRPGRLPAPGTRDPPDLLRPERAAAHRQRLLAGRPARVAPRRPTATSPDRPRVASRATPGRRSSGGAGDRRATARPSIRSCHDPGGRTNLGFGASRRSRRSWGGQAMEPRSADAGGRVVLDQADGDDPGDERGRERLVGREADRAAAVQVRRMSSPSSATTCSLAGNRLKCALYASYETRNRPWVLNPGIL